VNHVKPVIAIFKPSNAQSAKWSGRSHWHRTC